ncbi:MAG: TIGR01212 family radical SAM protein [Spirochaetia bacterium]
MSEAAYLTYARYLRERHGCAVYRVAVDAGFSCPNRSGGRSGRGCSYCDADGARAPYLSRNEPRIPAGCGGAGMPALDIGALERQVSEGIAFYRRSHGDGKYILFFQAYSNTNAPVEELRRVYDAGLAMAGFVGLNVATRPDCVDEQKAGLLSSYREKGLEVWVELGLQSASDAALQRVGRGHTAAQFERAFDMLRRRGLKIAVHLIFGLPGEGLDEILGTIAVLARLRPDGVKIHNLHVPAGTVIASEHRKGELIVPSPRRHLEYVIAAIERLPPETVIMRLTCDTPAQRLEAPRNFWAKEIFLSRLHQEMAARGSRQARLFSPSGRSTSG